MENSPNGIMAAKCKVYEICQHSHFILSNGKMLRGKHTLKNMPTQNYAI